MNLELINAVLDAADLHPDPEAALEQVILLLRRTAPEPPPAPEPEPEPERRLCQGLNKVGKPCQIPAAPGKDFCGHHGAQQKPEPEPATAVEPPVCGKCGAKGAPNFYQDGDEIRCRKCGHRKE